MAGRNLLSFDAFSKTVEDARIRTASGGLVTILSAIIITLLSLSEFADYRRIEYRPELAVDKARGAKMSINLNITFPHIPCDLLTMDILDVSGEVQAAISHGVSKTRLDPQGRKISTVEVSFNGEETQEQRRIKDLYADKGPDYCGSCWGSAPEGKRCCNTCEDVRRAYQDAGWAFFDGAGIEQCDLEKYKETVEATKAEGCNIAGHVKVNKVVGNFHFAPGSPISGAQGHSHDMSLYKRRDLTYTFAHTIHELSFGAPLDALDVRAAAAASNQHELMNPLEGVSRPTDFKYYMFQYFIKVVATTFERLDGRVDETNQYSVTMHERSLMGGRDEDHPHTLHSQGGVPGVYFSYDISPMKVINREQRPKSFGAFVTGVCSIIGGVLTVGAVIDRGVWEADKALRRKKNM